MAKEQQTPILKSLL